MSGSVFHRYKLGNTKFGVEGLLHKPRGQKALEASIQAIKEAYEKESKNLPRGDKIQSSIMEDQEALQDVKGDYGELVDKMIELGQSDEWLSYKYTSSPEDRFKTPEPIGEMSNRQAIKEDSNPILLFNSLKAFAIKELGNFTADAAGEKVVDGLEEKFKKFFEALGMIITKNDPTLLPPSPSASESMGGKKTRKHRKHRKSKKARKSHKKRNKSHRKK